MRAGPLRNLIAISRPTTIKDDRGQDVIQWSELGQTFAEVHQLAGRELEKAMQVSSEVTYRVTTRCTPGLIIRSSDRIAVTLWDGPHTLDLIAIKNVNGQNRMLEIDASEAAL